MSAAQGGPCGEETVKRVVSPQVLLMGTRCMFKDEDREPRLQIPQESPDFTIKRQQWGEFTRLEERDWTQWDFVCPQVRFDRPRHPGFEMFNTRKTAFLIKKVLQRGENTGGTVSDPARVERKKNVREGPGGAKNVVPCSNGNSDMTQNVVETSLPIAADVLALVSALSRFVLDQRQAADSQVSWNLTSTTAKHVD
ncbi:hypothetical protein NQZ68_004910 [Dissostichus eleginoides]|nr:hypothetical protein NQZ68_004910 [Dissostichus eleginoides]